MSKSKYGGSIEYDNALGLVEVTFKATLFHIMRKACEHDMEPEIVADAITNYLSSFDRQAAMDLIGESAFIGLEYVTKKMNGDGIDFPNSSN